MTFRFLRYIAGYEGFEYTRDVFSNCFAHVPFPADFICVRAYFYGYRNIGEMHI